MKVGDRVEILIGHIGWLRKNEYKAIKDLYNLNKDVPDHIISSENDYWIIDFRPEFVGKKAIITEKVEIQDIYKYSLEIDEYGHVSWFNGKQLKNLSLTGN